MAGLERYDYARCTAINNLSYRHFFFFLDEWCTFSFSLNDSKTSTKMSPLMPFWFCISAVRLFCLCHFLFLVSVFTCPVKAVQSKPGRLGLSVYRWPRIFCLHAVLTIDRYISFYHYYYSRHNMRMLHAYSWNVCLFSQLFRRVFVSHRQLWKTASSF